MTTGRRGTATVGRLLVSALALFLMLNVTLLGGENEARISSLVDSLTTLKADAPDSLWQSFWQWTKDDPTAVANVILPQLQPTNADSMMLSMLVMMAAETGDSRFVAPTIAIADSCKSQLLHYNCLRALSKIGSDEAGRYLLKALDQTPDEDQRYGIFNLLAEMQYEPLLPHTMELLKLDPDEYYWKSVFVFGKMGDVAVPFLLEQLKSKEENVRAHAVGLLGKWLIPPQAAQPLMEMFWQESRKETREVIISSIGNLITDVDTMRAFFDQVNKKDSKWKKSEEMQYELAYLESFDAALKEMRNMKDTSAARFQQEYDKLFESAGTRGDYELLFAASTPADEPQLKALRRQILTRNSDESFYDYQRVNQIIVSNRMLR